MITEVINRLNGLLNEIEELLHNHKAVLGNDVSFTVEENCAIAKISISLELKPSQEYTYTPS
jgi:hypothetical protein